MALTEEQGFQLVSLARNAVDRFTRGDEMGDNGVLELGFLNEPRGAFVTLRRAARFIVSNTLILIPVSLLFYFYLSGTGVWVYLAGASVFDALILATNIKLLLAPNKANAWLAFKFSSPYLALIFVLACVSVLI